MKKELNKNNNNKKELFDMQRVIWEFERRYDPKYTIRKVGIKLTDEEKEQLCSDLFSCKGADKMKRKYTTGNYFKSILMCNIDGIKIVDYTEELERNREIITFEFLESNAEVHKFLDDYRTGVYKDAKIENFDEMKQKRKELIREFLDSCYNK